MSEFFSVTQQDKPAAAQSKSGLGTHGEALAVEHLIKSGYRVVITNFKVPVGRNSKGVQVTGEIDVIALDRETLCFIEVKTRRSDDFAPIIAAVDARKQRQIIRTAKVYRRIFGLEDLSFRYDVVTVLFPRHSDPTVEITKGFWNEAKFRKHRWNDDTWKV